MLGGAVVVSIGLSSELFGWVLLALACSCTTRRSQGRLMRCRSIDHITGYRCPAASSPVAQVCERGVRANPLASLRAGSGTCSDITAFPGLSALNVVVPT